MACAQMFNAGRRSSLRVAAAIEMVHSYSLIHDDLPAMDNDALRRGKPSCHVKFGEANAILAGDALLTFAFRVLADRLTHESENIRINLIIALSEAAGKDGMVGGQIQDIMSNSICKDISDISRMQKMKTGALLASACEMGALVGDADDEARLALRDYALNVGAAFQIKDDLLDIEGNEAKLGKKVHKDQLGDKATFASLLGLEPARKHSEQLIVQAKKNLEMFGARARSLKQLATYVINREM